MKVSEQEQINSRIQALLDLAESSGLKYDDIGKITQADFDELQTLSMLAGSALPETYQSILSKTKFSMDGRDQKNLAERLKRSLLVAEKYGLASTSLTTDELIPTFSLEKSDHERLSKLCGDMRNIVFSSQFFDDPHKRRLLNRIAAIENEAMKEKGNLDTVLAGIVDVGDALGAFGRKVEPLTKRMQEVAGIAKKGSREYDQLPSPNEIKALPSPEDDENQQD